MQETCELPRHHASMLLDGLAPAFSTQLQPLVPKRMLRALSLRPQKEQAAVPELPVASRKPQVPAGELPRLGPCPMGASGASQDQISALRGARAGGGTVTPNGHQRNCAKGIFETSQRFEFQNTREVPSLHNCPAPYDSKFTWKGFNHSSWHRIVLLGLSPHARHPGVTTERGHLLSQALVHPGALQLPFNGQ